MKKLKYNNEVIYPITTDDIVYDNEGNTIDNKYIDDVSSIDQIYTDIELINVDIETVNTGVSNIDLSVLETNIGELTSLYTSNKNSIVDAINSINRESEIVSELKTYLDERGIDTTNATTIEDIVELINDIEVSGASNLGEFWYIMTYFTYGYSSGAFHAVGDNLYRIGGGTTKNTYCIDSETGSISTKSAISVYTMYAASAVVGTNIYLIGGYGGENGGYDVYNYTRCYNTSSNSWSSKTAFPASNISESTAASFGTLVYLFGGSAFLDDPDLTIELGGSYSYNYAFDTTTNTWTKKTNLPAPGEHMIAVSDNNTGIYLIAGQYDTVSGSTIGSGTTTIVRYYYPSTNSYTTKTSTPTTMWDMGNSGTLDYDHNLIYVLHSSLYCYDISTSTWTKRNSAEIGQGGLAYCNGKLFASVYGNLLGYNNLN